MGIKNLLNLKRQINKPEYFYNPKQLLSRLLYKAGERENLETSFPPAIDHFFVNESETIGRSLLTMGVYDLVVAETLKRILKKESVFLDAGANIGYFSRLACEWGGEVHSFEPHPTLFDRLQKNLKGQNKVQCYNKALSSKMGEVTLHIPLEWSKNEGLASLEPMKDSKKVSVQAITLDSLNLNRVDLLKIDVEGHELDVLKGAQSLLHNKKIEFIIFEDFAKKDSEVVRLLEDHGMVVKGLLKTLLGPKLLEKDQWDKLRPYEPPNFIAGWSMTSLDRIYKTKGWKFFEKKDSL